MHTKATACPQAPCARQARAKLARQPAPLPAAVPQRLAGGRGSGRKRQPAAAAVGGLLGRLFGGGSGGGGTAAAAQTARQRLLQQLSSKRPDKAAISAAVDELMAAGAPFREAELGGGPWSVVFTRGPLLWQGPLAPRGGRVVSPAGNQASQDFDPRSRAVVNRGELLVRAVALTAAGSYAPVPDGEQATLAGGGSSSSKRISRPVAGSSSSGGDNSRVVAAGRGGARCPVLVRASIEGGAVEAAGKRLALPIRGSGLVYVAYLDRDLRVFRAPNGSVSVQVRQTELPRLLGSRWQRAQRS